MALDLTGLSAWTQENTELLPVAILKTDVLSHVTVRSGVSEGTSSINLFSADFADAARACGFDSPTGNMVFDQLPITVGDRQIKQTACPVELRSYWAAQQMNPTEIGNEELPFEAVISQYYMDGVSKNIEDFVGQTLVTEITAANGAAVPAGAAVLTVANAIDQLNDLYDALDARVQMRDDVVFLMSPSAFRVAVRAMVAADLIHYNFADGTQDIYLPGTNAKLVKSSGITGDSIVVFPKAYAIFATGLEGEENFRMVYSDADDIVKVTAYYRRGLACYSIDQLATNGL